MIFLTGIRCLSSSYAAPGPVGLDLAVPVRIFRRDHIAAFIVLDLRSLVDNDPFRGSAVSPGGRTS